MPLPLLRALLSSFLPSSAPESTVRRAESCLPLARPRGVRLRDRFWRGRSAGDTLAAARLDFADALDDVRNRASLDIRSRIAVTRSLHELWHFREEVFSLVACRHDQAEAARRLAQLNRHFARRANRSAFAPLGGDDR
ncbi:MAG: hypothetical protein M3Y55_14430 [Pseudomonadota bacterium]|nr:hypothetical protein [Pseudomonadota bacterium]